MVPELHQPWIEDTEKENPALRDAGTGRWEEPEPLKSFLANDFQGVCPASLHFSSNLNPPVDTALLEKVQKIVMLSGRAQPGQANVPTK